ncbi:MAG: recombinase family protein [Chloroflexi bacterium]|nr:recombinase family protein [Chloroflexota bacterium]
MRHEGSTDQQEHEGTIQSQLAELRARLVDDGVSDCQEFMDEGYSRDDLTRPSLDRLRDQVAEGTYDRLYVQATDRLASGAKLVFLVEELQAHGVEVVFLKGSIEATPEGKLLLHMQGAIAEYERTKIAERTRRGKLHWARQGAMVGGHAPYGYKFIRRTDDERAHLEVIEPQASIVRDMFQMVAEEQVSTRGVALRLEERGIKTPKGANQWSPTTIARLLRNTVYKGVFYYQRTESVAPTKRLSIDPYKQNRKTGSKQRPVEDWIAIPVPVIVDEETWDAVQEQLRQNSLRSSRNNKRHKYLLRGLVRCPRCGGNYTGHCNGKYRAYRCQRAHHTVSSTGQRCAPGTVAAQPLEDAVWQAISEALGNPQLLVEEYQRRVEQEAKPDTGASERKRLQTAIKKVAQAEDRVTDAYINEIMDMDRYKAEMEKLRQTRGELERASRALDQRQQQVQDSQKALEHLDKFCSQASRGLDALSFEERQQLLQLVVEGITVDDGRVRVETIIPGGDSHLRNARGEPVEPPTSPESHFTEESFDWLKMISLGWAVAEAVVISTQAGMTASR